MRGGALIPLLVLAACSEGEAPKAAKAEVSKLDAGQWEMVSEVSKTFPRDEGAPAIKAAAGTKDSVAACVAEAERAKPAPALLAGTEDDCEYRDFYMARGRLNATMVCKRSGLDGEIRHSVNGTYTASDMTSDVRTETYLSGPGDVVIEAKVTGRRTGACSAAA